MNPQIERNFKHHPPVGTAAVDHARIRDQARALADLIDQVLPMNAGREKALAITSCEQAMMWANAGIARHSVPEPDTRCSSTL